MLDKQTLSDLKDRWINSIKLFFYDAGCSWTKLDLEENPDKSNLSLVSEVDWIKIYSDLKDKDKFENCFVTRTVTADHTWKEKVRYIYTSNKVKSRCWCGSSFSFGEKKIKIDLEKFKTLKNNFKAWE